jgi:hypothetical protein
MFLCNARLSILGMGDIKRDARTFVMGEGMGDTPAFMIKGGVPLATHISFVLS